VKELHVIDHEACISCGACLDVCPTDSIRTFPKHELKAEVV
jgi:formate hydrogenlyase subunit 6/NADH:ubiquinone oxidoreductase subunit I